MADIELVIKIPEKVYKAICDKNALGCDIGDIKNIIRNGTPLPKVHGKLFDENEIKKEAIRCEWSRAMYDKLDHTLSYMKPIIEADK